MDIDLTARREDVCLAPEIRMVGQLLTGKWQQGVWWFSYSR